MLFILVMNLVVFSQSLYNNIGHIPQSCQVDWTQAGLEFPEPATALHKITVTNQPGNDDSVIEQAINQAKLNNGLTIIYFPQGTYNLTQPIVLDNSDGNNIVFQGDGITTILEFQVGNDQCCFSFYGREDSTPVDAVDDLNKGSTIIYLENNSSFDLNDWVYYSEYTFPNLHSIAASNCVGQITQINDIGSEVEYVELKDKSSKFYDDSYDLKLQKIDPIHHVGIENLKINRLDSGSTTQGTNILFRLAVNSWLKGVEIENTCQNHVSISRCAHIEISGCYFNDANNHGEGGYGYGVTIGTSSTNCLVENNIFRKLRHSIILSGGANTNVFTYNYSLLGEWTNNGVAPDLCIHGNYPFSNLMEHNYINLMKVDDVYPPNGIYNAFFRNRAAATTQTFRLWDTDSVAVLGCYLNKEIVDKDVSYSIDGFGKIPVSGGDYSTWDFAPHNYVYWDQQRFDTAILLDKSYYYNGRPKFLSESYSFPSIGPKIGLYCQTIPAKDRYSNTIKTYLPVGQETHAPNMTWSGTKIISQDVTINSGETLTIDAGSNIKFSEGKRLTINGSLVVNGTSSNPVTFTSLNSGENWYAIEIYGSANIYHSFIENASTGVLFKEGSSGSVTNSEIRNNTSNGIYMYKALPTIEDCKIYSNVGNGIMVSNTNYVGNPIIRNNDIYENTMDVYGDGATGIYLYKSSPSIIENEIYSNDYYGIDCWDFSSPLLGQYELYGHNYIHDNGTGIGACLSSSPFIGENGCQIHGGFNSFESNSTHISASSGSYVQAEDNWWGSYPPQSIKFYEVGGGDIDYIPALPFEPSLDKMAGCSPEESVFDEQFSLSKQTGALETDYMQYYNPKWPLKRKLIFARNINWLGDIAGSQSICKDVIENYPDSSLSLFALDILWESSRGAKEGSEYDLFSFSKYLTKISSTKEKKELYGHSELINAGFKTNKSMTISSYDKVYNDYKGGPLAELALYDKFVFYYYEESDMYMAKQTAQQLEEEFPGSRLSKKANSHFKTSSSALAIKTMSKMSKVHESSLLPDKYAVSSNYPNPFNPSTSINFALPKNSKVSISVYNSLGQLVRKMNYLQLSAGNHPFTWNGKNDSGRNMSSGLYILHFNAHSLEGDNETFSKSIKLLLVS